MNVRVKLFAVARQLAGCEVAAVQLPEGATVAHLREKLTEQYPNLAGLSTHLVFAIDAEYANDDSLVPDSAEIACIPPVSGG
jgi:molybdopterin converting factor subunit 1